MTKTTTEGNYSIKLRKKINTNEIEEIWSWWDPQRWWFRLHTPLGAAQDGARRGELGYDEIVELIQAKQRQRHQEGATADQEL